VIDLETALADLAEHLDHPPGDQLPDAVVLRIAEPVPTDTRSEGPRHGRQGRRPPSLLVLAAAVVVILGTLLAIAPARRAIADWLGIGAVEIVRTEQPLPTGSSALTVPGAPNSAPTGATARQLAAAQKKISFPIATPHDESVGPLLGIETDARIPGGLVALRYRGFTLVEIASNRNGATVGKFIDEQARVEPVTVAGWPGLWITGAHQIGYLDRSGKVKTETVRQSGPVLLWARTGVTYRIEGVTTLARAQAIATTIR
jgi:hypothetical protein